jgi:hypothetical protein
MRGRTSWLVTLLLIVVSFGPTERFWTQSHATLPTLGPTSWALLTSALLVLGLAMVRWRTEP